MPSPEKTVRKSIGVCRRAGMNRTQALTTIVNVCEAVLASIGDESITMQEWIVRVRLVAVTALGKPDHDTLNEWRA